MIKFTYFVQVFVMFVFKPQSQHSGSRRQSCAWLGDGQVTKLQLLSKTPLCVSAVSYSQAHPLGDVTGIRALLSPGSLAGIQKPMVSFLFLKWLLCSFLPKIYFSFFL